MRDDGSPTRARTWDLRINSPSLYQLSYRGFETPVSVFPEKLGGAYSNSPQGDRSTRRIDETPFGTSFSRAVQTEPVPLGHNGSVNVTAPKETASMIPSRESARCYVAGALGLALSFGSA